MQVNLKKTDSETGNPIAADACYEIYQWDSVSDKFLATGGYNTYSVQRQGDGSYAVINSAAYAVNDAMRHTLYYTQRNQGKFILVETKASAGYFGDWTDIDHPGTVGTPLGKRGYYIEITEANDNTVLWLDNADYSADILTADKGGTKLVTSGGVETTVSIYSTAKDSTRTYNTDNSGKAANEDSYTTTATDGVMKNDRTLSEISISKVDLDAVRYVGGKAAHGTAFASGQAHGDAVLDGAVYDLYAAEDIIHPDGVTGVVDYSKIMDADGNPLWHTTIRDNSGQWVNDYLPILKKDHLVASAKIEDGWLTFANLYLGKYYVVERSTGTVIPLREGALAVSGTYPTVDNRAKAATGKVTALASNGGQYTDWVYKNQFSTISKSKALDGSWTYDAYSLSFANGYLCDEHNYYITPAYSDEGWYVEKTTFSDDRQAAGEQIDKTSYRANYHLHADNALAESQDQVAKGNVEISKIVSSSGQSNGLELENAGFTFYLVSDLSKVSQFDQTRAGAYTLQSILDAYINKSYDNAHLKWDFSGETQAIAKTYEVNAAEIAAYNKTLTAAGENKNGNIDYPVMQTPADPNYYLKHDFERNYTDYGFPFMQADCDALAPSDNLIIYGHNMKDGSMFADLAKYRSKDFWQSHKTVWFDTALGSSAYEVFAVIHTTVQADAADAFPFYRFVDAASTEEFADYVSACKARALYDTGISAEYGDKLLTLSTCDNITDNGRLLVIAKRI